MTMHAQFTHGSCILSQLTLQHGYNTRRKDSGCGEEIKSKVLERGIGMSTVSLRYKFMLDGIGNR